MHCICVFWYWDCFYRITAGVKQDNHALFAEKSLLTDYGNNLDGALGVVRTCHEELSKIVKSPHLKICKCCVFIYITLNRFNAQYVYFNEQNEQSSGHSKHDKMAFSRSLQ